MVDKAVSKTGIKQVQLEFLRNSKFYPKSTAHQYMRYTSWNALFYKGIIEICTYYRFLYYYCFYI